ncbi:MAG: type I glyceraldehyde-3-phosphate dehydrogenase [Bacteroidia bacterium]|nr:type I glyceraldehyde-3-phosphate dehydrogenase [Bacteroidia bacterium]
MKKLRVAINGFGRIGRVFFRQSQKYSDIEVVAINDLATAPTLAHLLKYDSIHRIFDGEISSSDKSITVNGTTIPVYSEKDPTKLPWNDLGIDFVLESTGQFRTEELASQHLSAGAKKVILSAPPKGGNVKSVVIGVNDSIIDGTEKIISAASCTTNSAAPLLKILKEYWEIDTAYVTTVHAYTSDQRLHDSPHKDLRRARAAAKSIIPTTTGAAKALSVIFPDLNGRIGGAGIRVPVSNCSLTDLTCILKKDSDIKLINEYFKKSSENELKGILQYTEDPIVSEDVTSNSHSCVFDAQLTSVLGKMVKVVGWYDNEMGYSTRLCDVMLMVAKKQSPVGV